MHQSAGHGVTRRALAAALLAPVVGLKHAALEHRVVVMAMLAGGGQAEPIRQAEVSRSGQRAVPSRTGGAIAGSQRPNPSVVPRGHRRTASMSPRTRDVRTAGCWQRHGSVWRRAGFEAVRNGLAGGQLFVERRCKDARRLVV